MQSNSSCQTCRTRRIKCDGAKPICQKCIKSHRTCVDADAAKQQQFAIHIENQYATGEKRRPRGPRSSLVPVHANVDLKTRAHAYYVQNHFQVFQDMPDVAMTWAECFHEWKAEGKNSPIVDLAFSAVALSVFSRFQNCRPAAAEASKLYLSLLRHMQNRIPRLSSGSLSSDEIDEYLLGAHLMARYEAFVQNHGDEADLEPLKEVKVWFHIDGAAAILKIWYDNRHRYTPTAIIRQTRRKLIKSCLLREQPVPRWLADGGVFGERDLALEFDHLTIQFIDLHHKYLELKQSSQNGILVTQQVDSDNGFLQHWHESAGRRASAYTPTRRTTTGRSLDAHNITKNSQDQKETITTSQTTHFMRNLGIEPRAPRRYSNGNGEFYH
ncbi:hypothetical protein CDV31_011625 [Fusarium ambrosium]|uniref:Zn(2)-C6 fungal-type domain-containing protein n=1 Tax=Fusarium ambrosium TaxID=131363 RepID=A0A428TFR3_9HYPO|nr:hypothetical protein CDV31_011625 [Fusarium ambrosium]